MNIFTFWLCKFIWIHKKLEYVLPWLMGNICVILVTHIQYKPTNPGEHTTPWLWKLKDSSVIGALTELTKTEGTVTSVQQKKNG